MSRRSEWRMMEEPPPRRTGPITHGLGVLFGLVVILYAGLFFASRTDGFRGAVEERLERWLGLPVRLEKTALTPTLKLRLTGLASRESDKVGKPGVRAREVLVDWSLAGWIQRDGVALRRVVAQGAVLGFAPGESGHWEPAALEALSRRMAEWGGFQLSEPAAPAAAAESSSTNEPPREKQPASLDWERIALDIREGSVGWWDAEGRELAAAEGVTLRITPLTTPRRRLTHIDLALKDGRVGDRRVHDLVLELLKTGTQDIVLNLAGDWQRTGQSREAGAAASGPPPADEE